MSHPEHLCKDGSTLTLGRATTLSCRTDPEPPSFDKSPGKDWSRLVRDPGSGDLVPPDPRHDQWVCVLSGTRSLSVRVLGLWSPGFPLPWEGVWVGPVQSPRWRTGPRPVGCHQGLLLSTVHHCRGVSPCTFVGLARLGSFRVREPTTFSTLSVLTRRTSCGRCRRGPVSGTRTRQCGWCPLVTESKEGCRK